ncbi:hypothetical protein L7F22_056809 [Adiantum nelumboides]|nr:hypothetical protein [Adiantum nelumboides]
MLNPRFLALLQPPLPSQPVGTQKQMPGLVKAQAHVIHATKSMETPVHLSETMQSPKLMPNAQEQVAETPIFQAMPVQPATFQQPIVGSNGSNLLAMQQVFPPPSIHPGYFGGGLVFQSMAGCAPGNQFYTPGTVFGGAQTMIPNPMYCSIGMQPGFQSTQGQFGMPQGRKGALSSRASCDPHTPSHHSALPTEEFLGRQLLAMNVMWKYREQRSFPLTEEEYLLRLDDVANNLRCWGAVSYVRNSLAKTKERPRIGKAVSIFIDLDESGGRANEWIYR